MDDRLDWSGANPEMARLILDRGDAYLAAQLSVAMAADQRAVTMASVLVALAAAMLGVAAADWADVAASAGAISAGAVFLLAAWLSFSAARPVHFFSNGAHPKSWWSVRKHNLAEVVGLETHNLQEAIEHNDTLLVSNAKRIRIGGRLAVAAPAFGFISWMMGLWLQGVSLTVPWIACSAP